MATLVADLMMVSVDGVLWALADVQLAMRLKPRVERGRAGELHLHGTQVQTYLLPESGERQVPSQTSGGWGRADGARTCRRVVSSGSQVLS